MPGLYSATSRSLAPKASKVLALASAQETAGAKIDAFEELYDIRSEIGAGQSILPVIRGLAGMNVASLPRLKELETSDACRGGGSGGKNLCAEFREAVEEILGVKLAFDASGGIRPHRAIHVQASRQRARMQLVKQGVGGHQDPSRFMRYWIGEGQCTPGFIACVILECSTRASGGSTAACVALRAMIKDK
ncbi:hypothetical protein WOLCODRAFT_154074 [Wolfiporia cocos MD-104 SS10]|uniref:Uncharacterized protein n=1 Tax=Wolfiporia cocos (strain MD-104) TaxID=742152 RepID=A0A2H3K1M6_WOLCO|nr:hypothetical protein WOLCODRAFT_154074 [Wolfiporia cocos MD-104 SS10]